MPPLVIHRVTQLDLKCVPWTWPFAEQRGADMLAHFSALQIVRPGLWNGRVLLGRNPVFDAGRFSADYFEADFASFLAWRDWGFPDQSVFNGFGMGAVRSSDGAFLLGEMGQHTSNAVRVYFPAGTPDLEDIKDGMVDMAGSVTRETEEETGFTAADCRAEDHWDCVVSGAAIAIIKILDVDMTAEALRLKVEANLASQASPELSAVHMVRSRRDLSPAMPRYVVAFLEAQFSR